MKKIISFSLWGQNLKYTVGCLKNIELAKSVYPDWKCRIYCAKDVPQIIIKNINSFPNAELILMNDPPNWDGMFWRFYAAEDADIFISRDTDSRLNAREKAAVDEWLASDKQFHIMRDHPYHNYPILGGMWGSKKPLLNNIKELISGYKKGNYWQVDQDFLREKIYNLVKDTSLVHDEFFEKKSFPTKREGLQFVGQVFDENDITVEDHINVLKAHIK